MAEKPVELVEEPEVPAETAVTPDDPKAGPDGVANEEGLDWKDKELKRLRDENAGRRVRAKEAEEELEKYRAAERKRTEDERKKNGEYEQLITEKDSQLEHLQGENKSLKERLESLETATKKGLLDQLPTSMRKKYEDFDVAVLQQIVPDLASRAGSPAEDDKNKRSSSEPTSLSGLSGEELLDLKTQNPGHYHKLLREKQ